VSIDATTDPENPVAKQAIGSTDVLIAKPDALRQSKFDREVLNAAAPGNIGTVMKSFTRSWSSRGMESRSAAMRNS